MTWVVVYILLGLLIALVGDIQLRKSEDHPNGWTWSEWLFVIFAWPYVLYHVVKDLWETRHE